MRKIDKLKQIERVNILLEQRRLNEGWMTVDNGDAEQERNIEVTKAILGTGEGVDYPELTPEQVISSGINYARNSSNIRTSDLATIIFNIIKNRL